MKSMLALGIGLSGMTVKGAPLHYYRNGLEITKTDTASDIGFQRSPEWKPSVGQDNQRRFARKDGPNNVEIFVQALPNGHYAFGHKYSTQEGANFFTMTDGENYYRHCFKPTKAEEEAEKRSGQKTAVKNSPCRMVSPDLCKTISAKLGGLNTTEYEKCTDLFGSIMTKRNELLKAWDNTSSKMMEKTFPEAKGLEVSRDTFNLFENIQDCMQLTALRSEWPLSYPYNKPSLHQVPVGSPVGPTTK